MMKVYASVRIGYGKKDCGRVCDDRILINHEIIDDGYFEGEYEEDGIILAVADGVGGTQCGWKAAETALGAMQTWDYKECDREEDIRSKFLEVNEEVLKVKREYEQYNQTATTLSALIVNKKNISVLHLGDSRIYQKRRFQGCRIFNQITEDKNNLLKWMEEADENGVVVSEETLKKKVGWDYITSYAGMEEDFEENVFFDNRAIADGIFVITSDGIHDFIDKEELNKILDEKASWKDKIYKIMDTSRNNGSCDDQSIIILELTK